MNTLLQNLAFSVSITGPICLMLLTGVLMKRHHIINDSFIDIASNLVFKVTLPALLFLSIIKSNNVSSNMVPLVTFAIIANIGFFVFCSLFTRGLIYRQYIKDASQAGVIIQGGFRSNTAIIGLAYITNAYGQTGVALAAVYVAAMTVLYNILAVITLTPKSDGSTTKVAAVMVKSISKNPLIIAIFLGAIVHELAIPMPAMALKTGQYFADMTLPLALLCTGGSLDVRQLKQDSTSTWLSTSYKLILCPLFITLAAYWYGFMGIELGLVFFLSSAPTAAASYVMARAMGGNATLAANIIALTTIGSMLTSSLGIFILSSFSLM